MQQATDSWIRGVATPNRGTVVALGLISAGISVVPAFWVLSVLALPLILLAHRLPTLQAPASHRFMAFTSVLVAASVFPRGALSLVFDANLRPLSLAVASWGLITLLVVVRRPLRGERLSSVAWLLVGAWMVGSATAAIVGDPVPWIDVWHLHQDAGAALLDGTSPYLGRSVPNPMPWFPEGSIYEGYTYPPVSLFTYGLTAALLGETRWIGLAIGIGLVIIVSRLSTSVKSDLIALILLMTPGWALMMQLAWTEPLSVLLLAAAMVSTGKYTRPILFGFFVASKQYLLLWSLPISFAWWGRNRRGLVVAALTAGLLYGMGAIYGWEAYIEWAFLFHTNQPQGELGASIPGLAWMLYQVEVNLPAWLKLGVATALGLFALRRSPRSDGSLVLSATLMLATFFILGTQSLPNYWYLLLGGLVIAILSLVAESEGKSTEAPPSTDPVEAAVSP